MLTKEELAEIRERQKWTIPNVSFGSVGMAMGAGGLRETYGYARGQQRYYKPTGDMTAPPQPELIAATNDQDQLQTIIATDLPALLAHIAWQDKVIEQAVELAEMEFVDDAIHLFDGWIKSDASEHYPEMCEYLRSVKPTSEEVG